MEDSTPHFVLQNSHMHTKVFLRNLYKFWVRSLDTVRQPWDRASLFLAHLL